ncbi:hypothetical protein D8674_039439 [Pyrus ussuriensis x Pyrus communis]|uniref:G domain-containing protein n=1 Tax=Pyrus ussuriensis x Pyrus communis TaxID=2448454 RepID=A0A5N5H1I8_9ROSA|nr:hypothetical protein D8674_039439 [Pyrus ussuriensis x Pyrus communis]
MLLIRGDLNGHGARRHATIKIFNGGHKFEERRKEEEAILNYDLFLANIFLIRLKTKLLGKEENDLGLDGFTPAGVGYGNIKEETIERMKKKKVPKSEKKRMAREAQKEKEEVTVLIKRATSANPAVVMVVDCVDFDGSFPKRAAKSLFAALKGTENDPKLRKDCQSLFLWPQRLISSGICCPFFLKELAGPRGNVRVIGAQNAGKSTLINALAKKEGVKVTKLTEAPVPGTTLGIWRVGGILSANAVLFDTPGLLHPYLVSMRLDLICKHLLIRNQIPTELPVVDHRKLRLQSVILRARLLTIVFRYT